MSYQASIARLQSLVEKYPLYSKADEALYLLGQNYEGEIARVRAAPSCTAPGKPPGCATEAMKSRLIEQPTKAAIEAYSKIITRYPIMDRVDDAKRRLTALHQTVPRPTKAAVAQNKAEDASRRETSMFGRIMGVARKGPNTDTAAKVGEPSLVDPAPVSAHDINTATLQAAMGVGGEKGVAIEKIDATGVPAANEAAPRSDAPAPAGASPFAQPVAAPPVDPNELKPAAPADTAPDPNELKPTSDAAGALPPPPQVNEIQQGQGSAAAASSSSSSASTAAAADAQASDEDLSSSKKKKKKGLKKIMPF
jgi:outer membrane protein assembly factor BamD